MDEGGKTFSDRIKYLAERRNFLLQSMSQLEDPENYRLVILNDVFFLGKRLSSVRSSNFIVDDLLNLINTRDGDYDSCCGMDFNPHLYAFFFIRQIHG
jgi:hypothetical protein